MSVSKKHLIIVRLDQTDLTLNLAGRMITSVTSNLDRKEVVNIDGWINKIQEKTISEISRDEAFTVESNVFVPVSGVTCTPIVMDISIEDILNGLETWTNHADVLVFCGHSKHSGDELNDTVLISQVQCVISKVEPTIVAFFNCDVGRPRGGFVMDISHRHAEKKGPIYGAFYRKVTAEELLSSAVFSGIKSFLSHMVFCSARETSMERNYSIAQICFSFHVHSTRFLDSGDIGIFYNDSRKDTTLNQLLCACNNTPALKCDVEDFAKYHLWLCGNGDDTNRLCQHLISRDVSSAQDFLAATKARIKKLKESEKCVFSLYVSPQNLESLCRGQWKNLRNELFCAAIYKGIHGAARFRVIISMLWNRLVSAVTKSAYDLLSSTFLLMDENFYLMIKDINGYTYYSYTSPFIGGNKKYLITYNTTDNVVVLLTRLVESVDWFDRIRIFHVDSGDVAPFDLSSYFGDTIADLYSKCCAINNNFVYLHKKKDEVNEFYITLASGMSLSETFKRRSLQIQTTENYTRNQLHSVLKTLISTVNRITQFSTETSRLNNIETNCGINEHYVKHFDNSSTSGVGRKRLISFPRHHPILGELWFMEIYPMPHDSYITTMNRCRFVVALPKIVLNHSKTELSQKILSGHVFYTDSHYGQDVFAALRDANGRYVIDDDHIAGNTSRHIAGYNWIDRRDFVEETIKLCRANNYFPFQYIGTAWFKLNANNAEGNLLQFDMMDEKPRFSDCKFL